MKELEKLIKEEVSKENPDYFILLELYSEHPSSKRNVVVTCEQRFRHGGQQAKLVYECEKIIKAEKFSGKRAIVNGKPRKGITIVKETKIEVPENYEYKVKYEELPEDLQKLIVQKGELYNEMEIAKKQINAIGIKNDDLSVKKRKELRNALEAISNKIKAIHALLKKYDDTNEYDLSELEETQEIDDPEWSIETLIEENNIAEKSWAEKKLMLKDLQSLVPKQIKRAKTSKKEETRKQNAEEAIKNQAIIDYLKKFFEENPSEK